MNRQAVTLVCSLDVEEEGLFRGRYCLSRPPVSNVARLERLIPLLDLGIRPTLFCAHAVLASDKAWSSVEKLAERFPVEIGTHLHHWNTPPVLSDARELNSVASRDVSLPLLAQKLDALLQAAQHRTGRRPTSFRMGRWDLRQEHWQLLAEAGIQADASVRPLHAPDACHTRPDHFTAPQSPYLVRAAGRDIVELPLTVTPLMHFLPELVSTQTWLPAFLHTSFQHWGALALLPVYHPLWAMQAITRLCISRGIRTLSLTWHSSEMLPGGNPVLEGERGVCCLLKRLALYVTWLRKHFDLTCMTLGELAKSSRKTLRPIACPEGADWSTPARPSTHHGAL